MIYIKKKLFRLQSKQSLKSCLVSNSNKEN